jgi:hypothetical protein
VSRDERQQAAADEMRLIAYREAVSLIGCAVLLIMLHPRVHAWLNHQAWKLRQQAGRRDRLEDAAVAELRRDISQYEHGEASL